MNYNKLNFVNGTTPAINAASLNHMEDGIYDAAEAITEVEADVTAHESQITQLQSQMQTAQSNINSKADKATTLDGYGITDAYTKKQIDNILAENGAGTGVATYPKTEIDSKLLTKVDKTSIAQQFDALTTDLSRLPTISAVKEYLNGYYYAADETYSSDEIDEKLINKANKATTLEGYGITDTYNKTQTDTKLSLKINTNKIATEITASTDKAKLPNIAALIAYLNSGYYSKVQIDEVLATLGQAQTPSVPSYWETAITAAESTVRGLQDTIGFKCVNFLWFSDPHFTSGDSYVKNLGILSKRLCDDLQIPYVVLSGDMTVQGNVSTADDMETHLQYGKSILAPIADKLLQVRGNHDMSYGSSSTGETYAYHYSPAKLWNKIFKPYNLNEKIYGDDGTYYYVDTPQRFRFIMLNSQWAEYSENEDGTVVYNTQKHGGYGQAQLNWLANTALNMPDGYAAVIVTHIPPFNISADYKYVSQVRDIAVFQGIVNAFCNKTSYSGSYNGSYSWDSVNISVNFENANGKLMAVLSGHAHQSAENTTTLACPCLTMTTACSTAYNESNITRTANSATETAIDIVSIDIDNDVIYCTRLGAGSGRTVTKTATIINHSITNNLSNVTTNNTAATIANNASYSAVLSAASGYTLSAVTVTMGGADITSTAYSNGTITIGTVTGDLIINATAASTAPSVSYTNLANPESAEWLNNTRLSSTATAVKTGSVVTNWIQCQKDDVIRIKGLDLFGTTGAEYLAYYEDDGDESHFSIKTYATAFTKDENGVYSYTVLMTSADNMASWADKIIKMRFSAIKTGDVIITKNEEIS